MIHTEILNGKFIHVDKNSRKIIRQIRFRTSVLSKDRTVPPRSPEQRDMHIVGAGASGEWAGQSGNLAMFYNGAWAFLDAEKGMIAGDRVKDILYLYDGSQWIPFADQDGTEEQATDRQDTDDQA